jgi:mRNA interferase MazF
MVAKARPAVIVSIPFHDDERALYTIVPHTTALRGGRFEVPASLRWLQPGAFDVQGLRNIPPSVLLRRLGWPAIISNRAPLKLNETACLLG